MHALQYKYRTYLSRLINSFIELVKSELLSLSRTPAVCFYLPPAGWRQQAAQPRLPVAGPSRPRALDQSGAGTGAFDQSGHSRWAGLTGLHCQQHTILSSPSKIDSETLVLYVWISMYKCNFNCI